MSIPLSISKSGMNAIQNQMDAVSHDIANINTTGYKSKNISFNELLLNDLNGEADYLSDTVQDSGIASGSKSGVTSTNFGQGSLISDSNDYHLAIAGEGFFGVIGENGERYLTRDGAFHVNGDKSITNDNGDTLEIQTTIPTNQWPEGDVSIAENGEVTIHSENGSTLVGTIPLFHPTQTNALEPVGENKFSYDGAFGAGDGSIQQNYLEASNVDLASSITEMMLAQRSYSLNLKVAQGTDEMASVINQFKQ